MRRAAARVVGAAWSRCHVIAHSGLGHVIASLVEDGVIPTANQFADSGLLGELDAAARELLTPYLRKQLAARRAVEESC